MGRVSSELFTIAAFRDQSDRFHLRYHRCNWYSFAANDDFSNRNYDKRTFERLPKLAKDHPDLCEMIPFVDVWNDGDVEDPWFKDLVPEVSIYSYFACPITPWIVALHSSLKLIEWHYKLRLGSTNVVDPVKHQRGTNRPSNSNHSSSTHPTTLPISPRRSNALASRSSNVAYPHWTKHTTCNSHRISSKSSDSPRTAGEGFRSTW